MLPGFNHNIRHDGLLFHVQTEDNGLKHSRLVTQVFIDGHLLAIEKSSYREITDGGLPAEERDNQIRMQMQNQHKELLRQVVIGSYAEQVQVYLQSQGMAEAPPAEEAEAPRTAEQPAQPLDASLLDEQTAPQANESGDITLLDVGPRLSVPGADPAQPDPISQLFDHFLSSVDAEVERHTGSLPRVQGRPAPRPTLQDRVGTVPGTQPRFTPLPTLPPQLGSADGALPPGFEAPEYLPPAAPAPPSYPPPGAPHPPVEPPISGDQPTLPAEPARRRRVPGRSVGHNTPPERKSPTERVRRMRRRPNLPRESSGLHSPPDETMLEMDAGALRRSLLEQRAKLRGETGDTPAPSSSDTGSLDSVLLRYLNESD